MAKNIVHETSGNQPAAAPAVELTPEAQARLDAKNRILAELAKIESTENDILAELKTRHDAAVLARTNAENAAQAAWKTVMDMRLDVSNVCAKNGIELPSWAITVAPTRSKKSEDGTTTTTTTLKPNYETVLADGTGWNMTPDKFVPLPTDTIKLVCVWKKQTHGRVIRDGETVSFFYTPVGSDVPVYFTDGENPDATGTAKQRRDRSARINNGMIK